MDRGTHETVSPAIVQADSANRVAQACKEAADAIAYAGDYSVSAWQGAERQHAMRQQAHAILAAIARLARDAAAGASDAAANVPETLADAYRMVNVDKAAAKRNADKCEACCAQCADAWGV